MCPACIANAALIVTGAISAGGWTALALRRPRAPNAIAAKPDGADHDRKESRS
jgi:hypothetical protein